MLTIKIKTENAAFEERGIVDETCSILQEAIYNLEEKGVGRYDLRDSNGNYVGYVSLR